MTWYSRAVEVLASISDIDVLERILLAHSPRFQAILDKAERRILETGGIEHNEFWKLVEAEAETE